MFSPAKAEQELKSIIAGIEADVVKTDEQFSDLYDPTLPTCPVPFFGKLPSTQYLTVGANPSADDFRAGNWSAGGDLLQQCLEYFHHPAIKPHRFFRDWEAALKTLEPCRFSFSTNVAHVDVSPRAAKSRTPKEAVKLFRKMVEHDITYLFRMLAVVWPNVRGLFAAGTVTKTRYIDRILRECGPQSGFEFRCTHVFPAAVNKALGTEPAKSKDARPKLYEVSYERQSRPLFFCPVSPSADRPGQKEQFYAQFRDNATFLRPLFCSDVASQREE